jgi:hypothetical protein
MYVRSVLVAVVSQLLLFKNRVLIRAGWLYKCLCVVFVLGPLKQIGTPKQHHGYYVCSRGAASACVCMVPGNYVGECACPCQQIRRRSGVVLFYGHIPLWHAWEDSAVN